MTSLLYYAGSYVASVEYEISLPSASLLEFNDSELALAGLSSNQSNLLPSDSIKITRYSHSPDGEFDQILYTRRTTSGEDIILKCYVSTEPSRQTVQRTLSALTEVVEFKFTQVGSKFTPAVEIQLSLPSSSLTTTEPTSNPFFSIVAVPFGRFLNLPPLARPKYVQPSTSSEKSYSTQVNTYFESSQATKFYPNLPHLTDYVIEEWSNSVVDKFERRKKLGDGVKFPDIDSSRLMGITSFKGVVMFDELEEVKPRKEVEVGVVRRRNRNAKL